MVFVRKFSEFPNGGPIANGDQPVGLEAGVNTIWEFTGGGGGGGSVITVITQDTSGLLVGRWVRFDQGTNLYVHGIATSAEFAEIEGVVLNILSPNQFTLQQSGYIGPGTPGFAGFTSGGIYFLSDTILGQQVLTVPITNGYVNKPLFAADSADSGWVICLMRGMIIGTPAPIPAPSPPGGTDTSIQQVSQPGNTFQIGNWVRVSGNNIYALADGTTLANAQGVGVVIAQGDPLFTIQFSGWNTNTVIGAVDGTGNPIGIVSSTVYYISGITPGAITPNPPTAIGSANKPAFISASSTDGTGWVLPQRPDVNNGADINTGIVPVTQNGHGLTQGEVVRISALNTYVPAQANNATNALPVGFVRQVIDANNFVLQTAGYCDQFLPPFTPLIPASRYFLSSLFPGAITTVEPINPSYSVPMLIALNPTTGYILEQRPLLAITPLISGGTQTALTAPGADSLFAWNFGANQAEFLGIGAGLAIVGGDLTATGGGGGTGWTIISTTVIPPGSPTISILNMTGFYRYLIILENIVPTQSFNALSMRTSSNNGASFDSGGADYSWGGQLAAAPNDSGISSSIRLNDAAIATGNGGIGNTAVWGGISGVIETINPSNVNFWKGFSLTTRHIEGGDIRRNTVYGNYNAGYRLSPALINAVQFYFNVGGNIASGTIKLLGTNS